MFLKNSLPLAQSSGFVAFDGGGAAELEDRSAAAAASLLARQSLTALAPSESRAITAPHAAESPAYQHAVWQPAVSSRLRKVEGLVIAAVCAYFGLGLAGLLGWL